MTSEWPPTNFVADVIETSAPSSSGDWKTGVRMLLSTSEMAPALLASAQSRRMSATCILGFVGDSSMSSETGLGLEASNSAASTAAASEVSTFLTSTPHCGATCDRRREVPP